MENEGEGGEWVKDDFQVSGLQNWMMMLFTELVNPDGGPDHEFSFC